MFWEFLTSTYGLMWHKKLFPLGYYYINFILAWIFDTKDYYIIYIAFVCSIYV